jgi:peptidylprolyl isomerase
VHAFRRSTSRRVAATVAAAALALTLTACGSDDDKDAEATPTATAGASTDPSAAPTAAATPSAEDIAALEAVTVEGDAGAEPTITLPDEPSPFTVTANVSRVITEGDGEAIEPGDILETQLTAVDSSGKPLGSTYEDQASQPWTVGDSLPALDDTLATVNIGAQVLLALTSGTDTAIYVFEPTAKIPNKATGTAVPPVEGLPTVTLAEDGTPTIEPSDADAPTKLTVQPLIKGDGAKVESGDNILVHYTGALWDGTVFDSSWGAAPFPVQSIGTAQVIDGWNEGLVGQTVGSQVLLVVPPDKGYGDQPQGEKIPAGSTLVFVVDILWAS